MFTPHAGSHGRPKLPATTANPSVMWKPNTDTVRGAPVLALVVFGTTAGRPVMSAVSVRRWAVKRKAARATGGISRANSQDPPRVAANAPTHRCGIQLARGCAMRHTYSTVVASPWTR
jgi:hypothetical protein